jgi:hypothetical protein
MSIDKEETSNTRDQQAVESTRRSMLGASGVLAAAGLLWSPKPASAKGGQGRGAHLVLDVACLGDSFAPNFSGALNMGGGDLRGSTFNVEGLVYPGGTIPGGPGFDPYSVDSMGHWLCRGWFLVKPGRSQPGVNTHQEYLLDTITPEVPSPADTLASSGVETGGFPAPTAVRAVTGGTGRYRHARGEVVQEVIGLNTTTLNVFLAPAPTFRFHFKFA